MTEFKARDFTQEFVGGVSAVDEMGGGLDSDQAQRQATSTIQEWDDVSLPENPDWADPAQDVKHDLLPQPFRMIDKILLSTIDAAIEISTGKDRTQVVLEDLNRAYTFKKQRGMGEITAIVSNQQGTHKFVSNTAGTLFVLTCKEKAVGVGHSIQFGINLALENDESNPAKDDSKNKNNETEVDPIVSLSISEGDSFLSQLVQERIRMHPKQTHQVDRKKGLPSVAVPIVFDSDFCVISIAFKDRVKVLGIKPDIHLCFELASIDSSNIAGEGVTITRVQLSQDARFISVAKSDGSLSTYELYCRFDHTKAMQVDATIQKPIVPKGDEVKSNTSPAFGTSKVQIAVGSTAAEETKMISIETIPTNIAEARLSNSNLVVHIPPPPSPNSKVDANPPLQTSTQENKQGSKESGNECGVRVHFICTPIGTSMLEGPASLRCTGMIAWKPNTKIVTQFDLSQDRNNSSIEKENESKEELSTSKRVGREIKSFFFPDNVTATAIDRTSYTLLAVGLESGIINLFNINLGVQMDLQTALKSFVVDLAFQGNQESFLLAASSRQIRVFKVNAHPVPAILDPCTAPEETETLPVDITGVVCFSDLPVGLCLCDNKQLVAIDLFSGRVAGTISYAPPPGAKTPGSIVKWKSAVSNTNSKIETSVSTNKNNISCEGNYIHLVTSNSFIQSFPLWDIVCCFYPSISTICKTRQQRLAHAVSLFLQLPHKQRQKSDAYKLFSFLPFHVSVPEKGEIHATKMMPVTQNRRKYSTTTLTESALDKHTRALGDSEGDSTRKVIQKAGAANSLVSALTTQSAAAEVAATAKNLFQNTNEVVSRQIKKQEHGSKLRLKRMKAKMAELRSSLNEEQ